MKSQLALSFAVLLVLACSAREYGFGKENVEKLLVAQIECASKVNLTDELSTLTNSADFPSFEDLGCYPRCFLQTLGVFGEDFEVDQIKSLVLPEKFDQFWPMIEGCVNQGGEGACQKAYYGYKCYAEHIFKD